MGADVFDGAPGKEGDLEASSSVAVAAGLTMVPTVGTSEMCFMPTTLAPVLGTALGLELWLWFCVGPPWKAALTVLRLVAVLEGDARCFLELGEVAGELDIAKSATTARWNGAQGEALWRRRALCLAQPLERLEVARAKSIDWSETAAAALFGIGRQR